MEKSLGERGKGERGKGERGKGERGKGEKREGVQSELGLELFFFLSCHVLISVCLCRGNKKDKISY